MVLKSHIHHFYYFSFLILILKFQGGPTIFSLKTFAEVYSDKLTRHKDRGFKKSGEDTDRCHERLIRALSLCPGPGWSPRDLSHPEHGRCSASLTLARPLPWEGSCHEGPACRECTCRWLSDHTE